MRKAIPTRSGAALALQAKGVLKVIDPEGEQVADFLTFNRQEIRKSISSERTFDHVNRIYLTKGDHLYSNRSNVMLRIVGDTVGWHDCLFAACSKEMLRIIYEDVNRHRGCLENLAAALESYGIASDNLPIAFNCFMNVSNETSY